MHYLISDENLKKLVIQFENGELQESQWHHQEHLAICYWYLRNMTLLEAIFHIKLGILKYNERYGVKQTEERGYHETITLFFIKFVNQYISSNLQKSASLIEGLRPLVEENNQFLPVLWQYYSRPVLNSAKARIQWVEPDIQKFE